MRTGVINRLWGGLFVLMVMAGVALTFAERPAPVMPATEVRIDHLLMLDAQRIGPRIVAVGERGHIFLSDDEGSDWRAARSPVEATLTTLSVIDDQTLIAAGHDAVILRSTDLGETWTKVFSAPEDGEPLLALYSGGPGPGFAVGAYGRFMTSPDGGQTWIQRDLNGGDFHLNAIAGIDGRWLLAGEAGTLLRSDDRGETWQDLESPYGGSFFGALDTADGGLIVFGMRGHVFRSNDLGATWKEIPTASQASLFSGRVMPDGRLFLVGQNGLVLVSSDHGHSFREAETDTSRVLTGILATDTPGRYLLVGERGVQPWMWAASTESLAGR